MLGPQEEARSVEQEPLQKRTRRAKPRYMMCGRVSGAWRVGRNHLNAMHTSGRAEGRMSATKIRLEAQVEAAALAVRHSKAPGLEKTLLQNGGEDPGDERALGARMQKKQWI